VINLLSYLVHEEGKSGRTIRWRRRIQAGA
jgi:hypothetical protein